MSAMQPSLFEIEQPRELECSGAELSALVESLRARGAIILSMTSICVSSWRLSLDWPNQSKPHFRSTGVQTG
jgi:hypothetical protein